jgi:hypothetical protein
LEFLLNEKAIFSQKPRKHNTKMPTATAPPQINAQDEQNLHMDVSP